ncbi:hypothetical protein [Janthinobacterium sp. RB2P8]|uniref:hypothetical protein n=1 Tax=Janthinobacterium sp. RB2P8 TaxID=3424191 RepID=UPI003F234699
MPSALGAQGARLVESRQTRQCSRMEQVYRDVTVQQARISSLSEVASARWRARLGRHELLLKCNVEIPQAFIDKTKQSFAELDKK